MNIFFFFKCVLNSLRVCVLLCVLTADVLCFVLLHVTACVAACVTACVAACVVAACVVAACVVAYFCLFDELVCYSWNVVFKLLLLSQFLRRQPYYFYAPCNQIDTSQYHHVRNS